MASSFKQVLVLVMSLTFFSAYGRPGSTVGGYNSSMVNPYGGMSSGMYSSSMYGGAGYGGYGSGYSGYGRYLFHYKNRDNMKKLTSKTNIV